MSKDSVILCGKFDGFTWLRCEGRGTFHQAPVWKQCSRQAEEMGETRFVIDLEDCTGMDSTFMGFLAGLATRMRALGGAVQIAGANSQNRKSLEDLGLDYLLEIEPPEASWRGHAREIRSQLKPFISSHVPGIGDRTKLVLAAHRELAGINDSNARQFANVLEVLEGQEAKEKSAQSHGSQK